MMDGYGVHGWGMGWWWIIGIVIVVAVVWMVLKGLRCYDISLEDDGKGTATSIS